MLDVRLTGEQSGDGAWIMHFIVIQEEGMRPYRKCRVVVPANKSALKCIQVVWEYYRLGLALFYREEARIVSAEFLQKDGKLFHPTDEMLQAHLP